jgi:hypothetical protein
MDAIEKERVMLTKITRKIIKGFGHCTINPGPVGHCK